MAKFRKKSVEIEAVQWNGDFDEVSTCVGDSEDVIFLNEDGTLDVPTLEGILLAQRGDWIIKGVKGEFYLYKPDIFDMTYELVQ